MAKDKNSETPEAPVSETSEFPVTLDEFLGGVSQAQTEMKSAFSNLCKQEKINGHKTRSEWERLFGLFKTMPVSATWSEWAKGGGK